jgi:hypothetical protein
VPSITSTWIQSAPAASIARTSSPSREKSAERIEGEISSSGMASVAALRARESANKRATALFHTVAARHGGAHLVDFIAGRNR